MVNVACRKDTDEPKLIIKEPSAKVIYRFALLAQRFSFDSVQIRQLILSDPIRQEVFNSLVRLELDKEDFDKKSLCAKADQIVKSQDKQQRKQHYNTRKKPCLTNDSVDQSLVERYSRVFDKTQKDNKKFIFLC
jgi:hypothetical protein